jgi:hypothetical protein
MTLVSKPVLRDAGDTSVSTFSWDTAYVASFPVVNAAIMAQQSFPATFTYTDASGIAISGNWQSWQLCVGGSGQNVQMECIVGSGSASGDNQSGDLTGTSVIIQIGLQQIGAATPLNDPTAQSGTGTTQALVANTKAVGEEPAVAIIDSTYPSGLSALLQDLLDDVFKNYFNANIGAFSHVFAVMNINEVADKQGFQWIKPNEFSYAVAAPQGQPIAQCAFGLLAMVGTNTIGPDQQYAVDTKALMNLPAGANSAFVISQNMVARNLLMNGAISIIQGSAASDFGLSADGLSVTNVNQVTWGNFQTGDNVIRPVIAAGNFVLRADNTYVLLEITDANYEVSPGVTVHMNMTQKFTYSAVQGPTGSYYFIPDTTGLGTPQISANVSLSEGLQITSIVTGVVAAVAGLLVIGSNIASAIADAANVAVNAAANTADLVIEGEAVEEAAAANPAELAAENEQGAQDADAGAAQPGNASQVQNSGIFTSSQFRLATGLIGALSGATAGGIQCAKAIIQKNYDDIPEFNDFAANCVGASLWPSTQGYTLKSASFMDSLVLGITLA